MQVLAPTIVVALIFWFVIRALFRVDRNERLAEAEVERRSKSQDLPSKSTEPGASGKSEE
ncbi:hypothetical protein GCM10008096_30040 [Zhihengliuella salsuginis]|uniref:Sec-independent protein translocase protein TatA n=1 Tax=Zhihengliuella salsuginis TaxID=578222 RepID=A0ABQ3GLS4_9MICC|nr:hypothetical protein GCM10008096_30040 [Zhihengliuella salsuginis]